MIFSHIFVFFLSATAASASFANCYTWPIIDPVNYDGDTLYIRHPGLEPELRDLKIRVIGVDTPEIRGDCPREKDLARKAKIYVRERIDQADLIEFCNVSWDKYGERIDAVVRLDGKDLAQDIIENDLGRSYSGGTRLSWCSD